MQLLTERYAEDFLEKQGFPVIERRFIINEEGALEFAKNKYPVVLKIVSKKVLHKSDIEGVKLEINNKEELIKAFNQLSKIKEFEGALIQRYIKGNQLILGLKKDPVFGHIILFGLGGVFTEIIKENSIKICPVSKTDVEKMIKELKGHEILEGARNQLKIDMNQLKHLILKLSDLSLKYPKIKELDINPLIANQSQMKVVDASIIFE